MSFNVAMLKGTVRHICVSFKIRPDLFTTIQGPRQQEKPAAVWVKPTYD